MATSQTSNQVTAVTRSVSVRMLSSAVVDRPIRFQSRALYVLLELTRPLYYGDPIPAAVVLKRMAGADDHAYTGLTNENGLFMFTQAVGDVSIELKVLAAGFNPYMSMPMRLRPGRMSLRLSIVLIPSMSMEVGLGGSPITVRFGSTASITAAPSQL